MKSKSQIKKLAFNVKKQFSTNKLSSNINTNIYHCCIQKTGSQWLAKILSDYIIYRLTSKDLYLSQENFLDIKTHHLLQQSFPENKIISPLYIRYNEFQVMPKPEQYKAFFVMRDLRDIVVSKYFSHRYSHYVHTEKMAQRRKALSEVSLEEGLMLVINDLEEDLPNHISALYSWCDAKDEKVLICKFEDMIGENSFSTFQKIFAHLDIQIEEKEIKALLNKYSFKSLAKNRTQGQEDQKSHYRKGITGDWENYFNENHKESFKKYTGNLLVELGYAKDMHW